jgi:hypothetical protein
MFELNPYYHAIIKKSIVAFGNLFTGIHIINKDKNGNTVKSVQVPISYADRQQWYNRLTGDPDFAKKFETEIPRLSFTIAAYRYNAEKKINLRNGNIQDKNLERALFNAVPYRLTFELSSYTKNQEDALQILEQILPYFSPAIILNIDVLPEYSISNDIPLALTGVNSDDNYVDLNNNRYIIQTFTFDMDIQLFGPIDKRVDVIKKTIVDVSTRSAAINEIPDATHTAEVVPREANKEDVYTIDEMWQPLN